MWGKGISLLVIGALSIQLAACGASRTAGWDRQQDRAEGDAAEVLTQADAAWEMRSDETKLREALTLYEKSVSINPNQLGALIRLARGYYFLSDGFYRGQDEKQLELYDTAASWGERAMALDPEFVAKVRDEGVKVEDALDTLDVSYVGAVYWSASAIGKWARLKGFTTLLSKKNTVKKFMEWATAQDENYYYAGPPRYWGVYYAVAPSFAGGDIEESKRQFELSLSKEPNYLGTKVLMADVYATEMQDRELFEKLLNEVISADVNVLGDVVPEQMVEQQKAKEMLAKVEDLFASRGNNGVVTANLAK